MENSKYAVYGTLKKGQYNHYLLGDSKHIGNTQTESKYNFYSVSGMFPAVTLNGEKSIPLEIYEVSDPLIEKRLDALEGYHGKGNEYNFYDKIVIDTEFGKCFMYIFNENSTRSNRNLTPINTW